MSKFNYTCFLLVKSISCDSEDLQLKTHSSGGHYFNKDCGRLVIEGTHIHIILHVGFCSLISFEIVFSVCEPEHMNMGLNYPSSMVSVLITGE